MMTRPREAHITASARHCMMLALPPAFQLAGSEICRLRGSPVRSRPAIVGSVQTHNRRSRRPFGSEKPRRHGHSPRRRTVCASTGPGALTH